MLHAWDALPLRGFPKTRGPPTKGWRNPSTWPCLMLRSVEPRRRLLNRLAHIAQGNTTLVQLVDDEAIYEVSGTRTGKSHRVWVDLRAEQLPACGSFLNSESARIGLRRARCGSRCPMWRGLCISCRSLRSRGTFLAFRFSSFLL